MQYKTLAYTPLITKTICELFLVFAIIVAIFGIPTETFFCKKMVPAKNFQKDKESFLEFAREMDRLNIAPTQYRYVYSQYFEPKEIEETIAITPSVQWSFYILLSGIYTVLMIIISLIASSVSSNYYYYILPIIDIFEFFCSLPKKYNEKHTVKKTEINIDVLRSLARMKNDLNNYFDNSEN